LLRNNLNRRIGRTGLSLGYVSKLWLAAVGGAAVGWGIKLAIGPRHPVIVAVLVLAPYGVTYLGIALALRLAEANAVVGRVSRIIRIQKR